MPLASDDVSALTSKMTAVLNDLLKKPSLEYARDLAREFLAGMFRLGLILELEPSLRDSRSVKEFFDRARALLPTVMPGFFSVADRLEGNLHLSGLEWTHISELRSGLEFFEKYFGTYLEFGMEDIDESLRQRAKFEGPAPVPRGLPSSHWWWTG